MHRHVPESHISGKIFLDEDDYEDSEVTDKIDN
jgi:hypothetical protein